MSQMTEQQVAGLAEEVVPSAQLLGARLEPFSPGTLGYLATHELLTVDLRSGVSHTFFVKSVARNRNLFDERVFRDESRFFADVVPLLLGDRGTEPWAPRCHLVKRDVLVLEDLRARGFEVGGKLLSEEQLGQAVVSLARFHAASLLAEAKLGRPLGRAFPGYFEDKVFLKDGGYSWSWLATGIEVAETVARGLGLDPSSIPLAYDLMLDKVKPAEGRTNVLCHCDLWSNNLMFDGATCRLVDFQLVLYAFYALDLAQLLHLNATRDARRAAEGRLLELYHKVVGEELRASGAPGPEPRDARRDLEESRLFGLVMAVQYFPIALLNQRMVEVYSSDPDAMQRYTYSSRRELALEAMRVDPDYKSRVEEAVKELVEYMENR